MTEPLFEIWLYLGIALVAAEFILPGLVAIFLGMGALSVAGLVYYGITPELFGQLLAWFLSSLVYIFTLRILIIRMYPSDTVYQDIDEDDLALGLTALVTEAISGDSSGRISYRESSWPARSECSEEISEGEEVTIIGRDNITRIVKRIK